MEKILIIDDEQQHVALVRLRLEKEGFRIVSAGTGAEGIAAAGAEKPDLVLLDLMLPDMAPADVIRALRSASGVKTPIMAFTTLDPVEIRRRRLDRELSGVICKPYEPAELLENVRKVLSLQRV